VADRFHVIRRDLQKPAQILVEQAHDAQRHQPGAAQLDRSAEMPPGDLESLPPAERATARQTPMRTEGLVAGEEDGGNPHRIANKDVFTMNVCVADPVDGLAGGRFAEGILERADAHVRPVEVGQMQNRGASLAQYVLGLAAVAYPSGSAAAWMAFV